MVDCCKHYIIKFSIVNTFFKFSKKIFTIVNLYSIITFVRRLPTWSFRNLNLLDI
nr:MAG TPA: hypothetical protein [Caudoviricetes sp.]